MAGLLEEGEERLAEEEEGPARDAAIIAAAQRVEHYEIAAYGTARTYAQHLGLDEATRLLQTTLDEEGEADQRLTQIAESNVNVEAATASTSRRS
jgi:ferritin-like metal-binding protein YciE